MVGKLVFERIVGPFASLWSHLKETAGLRDPSELTLEDFRVELAGLGLLGKSFGPEEYPALEQSLGIEIWIEELPDRLAKEGDLAEVVVDEGLGKAFILVRESLRYRPWPAYELSIFHELSHLAAGHPLRVRRSEGNGTRRRFRVLRSRLAKRDPSSFGYAAGLQESLETEARKRAKWLVLAGTCPGAFEADKADRLT